MEALSPFDCVLPALALYVRGVHTDTVNLTDMNVTSIKPGALRELEILRDFHWESGF